MFKLIAVLASVFIIAGCENDARVVARNQNNEAENFKLYRKILFYNSFRGEYVFAAEGFCNLEIAPDNVRVTCKDPNGSYFRHMMGRSANMDYYAIQTAPSNVSSQQYKVTFKPSEIVPMFELR